MKKRLISAVLVLSVILALTSCGILPAGRASIDRVTIAAGWTSSFAIQADGSLWAWGSDDGGQLGGGPTAMRYKLELEIWNEIESAWDEDDPGMAFNDWFQAWGGWDAFRREFESRWDYSIWEYEQIVHEPIRVMEDVVAVSAGESHTMAIRADGSLWVWGEHWWLIELDNGTTIENTSIPVQIMENVVAVSTGETHTMAIRTDGSLWAWGSNRSGQIGDGTVTRTTQEWSEDFQHWITVYSEDNNRYSPVQIMENVIAVSVGEAHTMAITSDGTLWGWGDNRSGQIGDGTRTVITREWNEDNRRWVSTVTEDNDRYSPVRIMEDVIAVSAGARDTMAITSDGILWGWGDVWAWGYDDSVDLVESDGDYITKPAKIMEDVVAVSAGGWHTMAITSDGTLWGWGHNSSAQLGDGTLTDRFVPKRIMENVIAVSAGEEHTMAVRTDGSLWIWGSNEAGQLGFRGGSVVEGWEVEAVSRPTQIMNGVMR